MLTNIQVDVVKWGNSSAACLPASMLKMVNIEPGARRNLDIKDGCVVLERAQCAWNAKKISRVANANLMEVFAKQAVSLR